LTVLIQFGTVLWTPKLYWLLLIVPIWGGWSLYSATIGAAKGAAGQADNNTSGGSEDDPALAERRQKRSERRRQKRA
jgi:SRP-independent targeting protein 2/TMEM208